MTIRKLWLIILISVAILSVGINSLIFSTLTDNYFMNYLNDSYDIELKKLIGYTEDSLSLNDIPKKQIEMEYKGYLSNQITEIKLYSPEGELLIVANEDYMYNYMESNMMNSNMMNSNMMDCDTDFDVDSYQIKKGDLLLGVLHVASQGEAENSNIGKHFKDSLLTNSLISLLIVFILVLLLGLIISKKMSNSLIETARMATNIQTGANLQFTSTTIREINVIRDSLKDLSIRLRLKKKSRKTIVDGLVHQTRTPLTILKSHIEAIEDGVIDLSDQELSVCLDQIENLTLIISNMSGMIDADKGVDNPEFEWIDVEALINQITSGLLPQFELKSIKLDILNEDRTRIYTDKYKLSQSIFNLLVNAYKYTNVGGEVRIITLVSEEKCIIELQDTGIGINSDELDKVFTAYYRGSNSSEYTGDGIGLYIVKENIQQIGGQISLSSKVEKGSTFKIELPINNPNGSYLKK